MHQPERNDTATWFTIWFISCQSYSKFWSYMSERTDQLIKGVMMRVHWLAQIERRGGVQGPSPPLSGSLYLMALRMFLLSISSSDTALWLWATLSRALLNCSSSSQWAMPPGCTCPPTAEHSPHTCATAFGHGVIYETAFQSLFFFILGDF